MRVVVNRCNRGNLKHGLPALTVIRPVDSMINDLWISTSEQISLRQAQKIPLRAWFAAIYNRYMYLLFIFVFFLISGTKFTKREGKKGKLRTQRCGLFPENTSHSSEKFSVSLKENVVDKTRNIHHIAAQRCYLNIGKMNNASYSWAIIAVFRWTRREELLLTTAAFGVCELSVRSVRRRKSLRPARGTDKRTYVRTDWWTRCCRWQPRY